MKRNYSSLLVFLCLLGCAHQEENRLAAANCFEKVIPFSENKPGDELPAGWEKMVLFHGKPQTRYRIVADDGRSVLHAYAPQASSGLMQSVNIDPFKEPYLDWRWKISSIVKAIDPNYHATEDSPARVILGFDGDKGALSFGDQVLFETAKLLTGYDFPYATLMYVWDKDHPVGSILSSHRSDRIRMIVVANAAEGVGTWRSFHRNVVRDFEMAFGEKPGPLIGVGVLTDTSHVGETVEAWYGDIRLSGESGQALK